MNGFFLFCFIVEVSSSKYLQISSNMLSKILKASMSRCRCVIKRIQRNDSTESVNLTCQSARTVRLFFSNQFCPLSVVAIILLVTSKVATLSFTQHQRLRALIFLMFPPQKNIIFFMEHISVDLPFPY